MPTKIEWCHPPGFKGETWNPITGCSPVSEGCKNCYAQRMAHRLRGRAGYPADEPFRVTVHPKRLGAPLRWRKPRLCFVCSMGDLFHEHASFDDIYQVFDVILEAPQHRYVILTKRPERMADYLIGDNLHGEAMWNEDPWPNVWLGVSCENQRWADERIPVLLEIPAAVRLVSLEPLLGPVQMDRCWWQTNGAGELSQNFRAWVGINWVIIGGETGPGARLCKVEWIRQGVHDCKTAGVPCFVKALGSNSDHPGATGRGADMSQWPEDIRVREFPYMNQRDASASSAQAPGAEDGA